MSNVLIGIIGVILFIGLALAGALYLGGQFQNATHNSRASAAVQAASQLAAAANLYATNNGTTLTNTLDVATVLRDAGYLKTIPGNPVVAANVPFTIGSGAGLEANTAPTWVLMYLGQSTTARDICIAIERQMGHTDRLDPAVMEQPIGFFDHAARGQSGCHRNVGSFDPPNGGATNDYVLFYAI